LVNGKVITVDPADTIAQAVAVKDGLIQAVGDDKAIRALVGEKTKVMNLGGKAVTPGLIDPHNHLQVLGQLQDFYVPFLPPEVTNLDDMRAKLAEVVAQKPEGEWIMGYFMVVGERLPNRHDLDPVSPNHPVWLLQQGGHYGSCNTRALEAAGITADTPSPEGGLIEKDANGQPTGVFYNHRAMDVLRRVAPGVTPEMTRGFIAFAQPAFAACGVTTFHDNNVRGVDTIGTYFDTDREGKMLIRGRVYYTLEWPSDVERALKEVEYYEGNGFMCFAGFKFLLDGQALMAYCHQPHNGVRWDMPTWEPQSFKDAVRALHDTGLQICVHCVGDAAVDLTLDAYEAAMNANPRPDPRHRIEHCILSTPQATQRIKDLGVVVSTQPQLARLIKSRDRYVELFGEERTRRFMVTREWLEAGIPLALGSDAPTTPWLTPQVTIAGAMSRINYSNETMGPEQCLTVQEALRAHTMGSAYAGFEEDVKGSIEMGKLADLAVWDEDPYTASLNRLWKIPIVMTLVGGKIIHQA
jgi:predicted amidohydrolase YtcJ